MLACFTQQVCKRSEFDALKPPVLCRPTLSTPRRPSLNESARNVCGSVGPRDDVGKVRARHEKKGQKFVLAVAPAVSDCKLFVFDRTGSGQRRGRALLWPRTPKHKSVPSPTRLACRLLGGRAVQVSSIPSNVFRQMPVNHYGRVSVTRISPGEEDVVFLVWRWAGSQPIVRRLFPLAVRGAVHGTARWSVLEGTAHGETRKLAS